MKFNILPTCNVKTEYKFFLCQIHFLLLRDNKNISPWEHSRQCLKQNFLLYEKKFCVEQKVWFYTKSNLVSSKAIWCCTKKCFVPTKQSWCCTKIVFHVDKIKVMLHTKKIFCAQKSCFILPERHAILSLFTPYAQMKSCKCKWLQRLHQMKM